MARDEAARAARAGGGNGIGLLVGPFVGSRSLPGGHYLAGLAGCPKSTAQEVRASDLSESGIATLYSAEALGSTLAKYPLLIEALGTGAQRGASCLR